MSAYTNEDGFSVRSAVESDIPTILHFIRALAEFEGELAYVSADENVLRESLFLRKSAEVIIGEYAGQDVGFAVFHENFSTFLGKPGLHLVDLYIEEEWRNRGFGNVMLSYLSALAVERCCGRLEWWVHDWNKDAKRFYKRIRAREVENIRVYRLAGKDLFELGGSSERASDA